MGLFDFAASIGNKIFGDDDDAGKAIENHIAEDNPGVENLEVSVDADGVATVKGEAEDKSAWEKVILMAGNALGINSVNADELKGGEKGDDTFYYTIEKGDTLWAISAKYLGNGAKYNDIFEANREVIKDPDLIFPGQKIRIPGAQVDAD